MELVNEFVMRKALIISSKCWNTLDYLFIYLNKEACKGEVARMVNNEGSGFNYYPVCVVTYMLFGRRVDTWKYEEIKHEWNPIVIQAS